MTKFKTLLARAAFAIALLLPAMPSAHAMVIGFNVSFNFNTTFGDGTPRPTPLGTISGQVFVDSSLITGANFGPVAVVNPLIAGTGYEFTFTPAAGGISTFWTPGDDFSIPKSALQIRQAFGVLFLEGGLVDTARFTADGFGATDGTLDELRFLGLGVFQYEDVGNQTDQGFGALTQISAVPIPAALPLFLGALAGLGGIGLMRRRKAAA